MKYWNKSKKYRESWTVISDIDPYTEMEAKRWCQLHESNGRFFFTEKLTYRIADDLKTVIANPRRWYFENAQDATVFKLVWIGK